MVHKISRKTRPSHESHDSCDSHDSCSSAGHVLSKGAEAIIYHNVAHKGEAFVIKERVKKSYRIPEIDLQFRKFRTRREAKMLEKLQSAEGIYSPKLLEADDTSMTIKMEFINGPRLRDVLETLQYKDICRRIGRKIALMHSKEIIHSDLTTSNMIVAIRDGKQKIYFIDFGLSFFSQKIEDRAVDLHLLRQALESKHYTIWEECFEAVLEGYKTESRDFEAVIKRLIQVENRGRYKHKTDYYTELYGKLFESVS